MSVMNWISDPMVLTIIIFVITYIFIASEKIDKAAAAIIGSAVVIIFNLAPYAKHIDPDTGLEEPGLLNMVDLNVIYLLAGMMVIVNILSRTGLFEWIAITLAQKAKGRGMVILINFLLATAVLSALLDNVTTIILIAPITILVTQILEVPTVPVLILEAVFSNIGGTSTLVGDPPNIVIGSKAGLTFMDFIVNLGPPILIIMVISLLIVIPIFRKSMVVPEQIRDRVMKAHPEKAIINPKVLWRALPIFAVIILGFFVGHAFHVEPGIIALGGALVMAVVCEINVHEVLEHVEWGTIFFFIGLFMLIGALEHNGVFELLGETVIDLTDGNLLLTVMAVLWFCAIFSAIVDNIPLVIAMMPLLQIIIPQYVASTGLSEAEVSQPLYWALALGACLGGNGSLIGASANVVVSQIAVKNKYKLSFMDFSKYGFPMMLLSLVISTLYIYLRYF